MANLPPTPPVVPLTSGQQRYLDERIATALRGYVRKATAGFVILTIGLVTGFTINENHAQDSREAVVKSAQAAAVLGCNRDFGQAQRERQNIRDDAAQIGLFVKEGTITQAQGERAHERSKEKIANTPIPDCRTPLSILTSDPDDPIVIPVPLYPDHTQD